MSLGAPVLLDLGLVLVLLWYAGLGWRQGLAASALSLVGFLAGGALAMWALPLVLARWRGPDTQDPLRSVVVVLVVFALAVLGQGIGLRIGHGLRERVPAGPARTVDAALGVVATTVTAAVLVWFLAGAVRGVGLPAVSRAIGQSQVIQAIGRVVPAGTLHLFSDFTRTLEARGFPRVFEGVRSEPIPPAAAPDTGLAKRPGIRRAAGSIVRIDGVAPSCSERLEGSGWVVSPGRVVTNAHVVAGTRELSVRVGGVGDAHAARVVLFDPERDVAVLDVPGLTAPPLRLGDPLERGDDAVAAGFPLGGPYTVSGARVRAELNAKGADIYGESGPVREVYSLRVRVRPGSSGGPLLDTTGRVAGVIFATSLDDPQTGYALTLAEVRQDLREGVAASSAVSTGRCASP